MLYLSSVYRIGQDHRLHGIQDMLRVSHMRVIISLIIDRTISIHTYQTTII